MACSGLMMRAASVSDQKMGPENVPIYLVLFFRLQKKVNFIIIIDKNESSLYQNNLYAS